MKCWQRFSCDFDDALLPQSNHRRHCIAPAHLVSDCDPAYHLSRVNAPIKTGHEAEAWGESVRAPGIIAIVGPTASGKSELGIQLARRIGGEIVNCDSVQVYQGIQIATAKVSLAERRGVPHHLIDFVSPSVNFTAADWARAATEKIDEIEARGRSALLVGGTGLYLRALRLPFFDSPPTDQDLRARLTPLRNQRGPRYLHRNLPRLDAA